MSIFKKLWSRNFVVPILTFLTGFGIAIYATIFVSYEKGFDDGSGTAISYFNQIVTKQANSDTTVTKLIVQDLDTNVYYFSKKSIWDYSKR